MADSLGSGRRSRKSCKGRLLSWPGRGISARGRISRCAAGALRPRSVYLSDQKLPVDVPRVRNVGSDTEVPLRAYQALQTPRQIDEGLLLRLLKGIATRNYEACAETVPEAFGLSRSSVSRRYVKGTARKLAEFSGAIPGRI